MSQATLALTLLRWRKIVEHVTPSVYRQHTLLSIYDNNRTKSIFQEPLMAWLQTPLSAGKEEINTYIYIYIYILSLVKAILCTSSVLLLHVQ